MPTSKDPKTTIRPPIVVVMGHIDHGKSTLLDYIRKANTVAAEKGGITQHMGAYEAEHNSADGKKHVITFLDTPGHEAFDSIRKNSAKAADIAILVVSAEDGVKPQTMDAYNVAKSRNMPIIVAINKIDKPNADINKAKQSLGEHEIYLEGWGGDIPNVAISALNGTGIAELLDMIILVAELADLKADNNKKAEGLIIESELDSKRGIRATLLVRDGTLKIGDFVVSAGAFAPVRFIENFKGDKIREAHPSQPVRVTGWNKIPETGLDFGIASTKKEAEKKATEAILANDKIQSPKSKENTDNTENIVVLPLIIKADTIGSLEGIRHEIDKIGHDKVKLKIVSQGIGEINENDVKIALSDPSITIVGFNAEPEKKAAAIIERTPSLNVKNFSIIYELTAFISESLMAKVPKEYVEESTGIAKVLASFSREKDKQVLGGKVESGTISPGNNIKIMRRGAEIGRGKIRELQEKKQRVSEVAGGHEFGVMVEAKIEIAVGDRVEAVRTVEKK